MDNNMKLLAKISRSRFNLIALIFQNFPVGACPQTPLEGVCFTHCAQFEFKTIKKVITSCSSSSHFSHTAWA